MSENTVFMVERREGTTVSQIIVTHWGHAEGRNAAKGRISAALRVSRGNIREIMRAEIPKHLRDAQTFVTDGVTHSAWTPVPQAKRKGRPQYGTATTASV